MGQQQGSKDPYKNRNARESRTQQTTITTSDLHINAVNTSFPITSVDSIIYYNMGLSMTVASSVASMEIQIYKSLYRLLLQHSNIRNSEGRLEFLVKRIHCRPWCHVSVWSF